MATIALDASYIFDTNPTGIAIYSRRLIEALAELESPHRFQICYRLSRIGQRRDFLCPPDPRFSVHLFQRPLTFWQPWQAEVFHSLAQRPPSFRFKHEVVTIHDVFPITGPSYSTPGFQRKFTRLVREALARSHRVLVLSEYTAGQVMRHCGVASERIRIVPGGVDPPVVQLTQEARLRERERLAGKGNELLLTVGVLDNRKNLLNSLRALELLPEHYRLVLAGGNGYGSETVHEFIRAERLERRVQWLGYVPRGVLTTLFQAASVLVYPSLEEGFGFPMLEAMAHGLPVVTSRTSALPEVGGEAALYADPLDPADIAAKVLSAVEDAGLRQGLTLKGLVRSSQFTWRRTAERTLRVYDEVIENR